MKTIGLVGGLSWVSTAEYYRLINAGVRSKLGGYNSGHIFLDSLNEQQFVDASRIDPTDRMCEELVLASVARLRRVDSEVVALCANGIHRFAPAIEREFGVELVNIAEATSDAIAKSKHKRVGILGVRKTMEGTFFRERLEAKGIEVIIPDVPDRDLVHQKIMEELVLGNFREETRQQFLDVFRRLHLQGAQSIVLGCTEIPLLMSSTGVDEFELLSTTDIHCEAIVRAASS